MNTTYVNEVLDNISLDIDWSKWREMNGSFREITEILSIKLEKTLNFIEDHSDTITREEEEMIKTIKQVQRLLLSFDEQHLRNVR